MAGKANMLLEPAHDYYKKRYKEHVDKWHHFNNHVSANPTAYALWTFAYNDWDSIRKITLHMFNKSAVSQLKPHEVDVANIMAINITKMIFDQIDVIGHSEEEIDRNLLGDELGINDKNRQFG